MPPFRFREDERSSTGTMLGVLAGAIAGFAVGMLVAQRIGGFGGVRARLRRRAGEGEGEYPQQAFEAAAEEEFEEYEPDELVEEGDAILEHRVLEVFRHDPILSERAIDIGSAGEGVIELTGWVDTDDEAEHAVTVARGVPEVDTVVNRLAVGDREDRYDDAARRYEEGEAALSEARWEGNRMGTGRRRQGSSADVDRHADPRPPLEDRWLNEQEAERNAADTMEGLAERRRRGKRAVRGDRTGGAPVAPTGVPKGDHVARDRTELGSQS